MSKAFLFPTSKTREIANADPDMKDLGKQSVEVLRQASQFFAHALFTKCSEEARHHKRQTSNIRDFIAVVSGDDSLRAMLGPFLVSAAVDSAPSDDAPEEEEHDEPDDPRAASEIEDLLRRDSSDSSSSAEAGPPE
jgi:histone H3/H4